MSIFTKIFGSKAAKSVEALTLTEAQKAVAALKTTTIGAAVAADIKTIGSKDLSGEEKFAQVLANTTPAIAAFVSGGGVKAAAKDVEDIARALVQSIFNDVASTKAGSIATTILKLLGIK